MGRIFISAAHGGRENGVVDTGAVVAGTTEAREMILTRDLIVTELRSRGFEVLSVPDELSQAGTLAWINSRSRSDDVALEISTDVANNPAVRGATVYFIGLNDLRKTHADLLLRGLFRRVPEWQPYSRGARPDTATGLGSLAFCRQVVPPSLVMEVGFLSNPDDRFTLQSKRREIALGIADGLSAWSQLISPPPKTYPAIDININGQRYSEQGVLISGNAFIPIDLADRLGVNVATEPSIRRVTYNFVVYIKAIDLRAYNISVSWDNNTRTVLLRSVTIVCPGLVDQIRGRGVTTEVQMQMFIRANNSDPEALRNFPDLPRLYREEATVEGINYDIAFCQMCVETNFLRFGGDLKPNQFNFAGLGAVGGGENSAMFKSAREGVRAHVQHLKAYANTEPLVYEVVDPRFRFITRGVAPLVGQLTGRWNSDPQYGDKIVNRVKQLYELSNLA